MEKPGALNFEVGQLAEMRTFEHGFRGAWFRCKVKDIQLNENKIWLEYYDFDDSEEPTWEKIYQVPPYPRKSKFIKRELMVRPKYPDVYRKSEMPPVNSISQACVIFDGPWKVGDLVDWFELGCFWSARVVKVLSEDKVQVELPMPPSGEGKEGEEGKYEAFCSDLRPSLEWSETEGWTLNTMEGHPSSDAQLIFPRKQDMDSEPKPESGSEPEPELAKAGSTTRKLGEGDKDSEQNEKSVKMDSDLGMDLESRPGSESAAAGSTTCKLGEGDRDSQQNEKSVNMDCDLMESSESISSLHRMVATDEVEKREWNIMHECTLEAALLDLEELVAKVKWMQRLLQSPSRDAATLSWKLA